MVVYTLSMIKSLKDSFNEKVLRRHAQTAILPLFIVIGLGVIAATVLAIVLVPRINPGSQRGVGANGFHAYVEEGGDLGVGKMVSKQIIADVLGKKAKSVSDVKVSKVFNLNENKAQTATYEFIRSDGVKSSVYVDLMRFKNQSDYGAAAVTANTLNAGMVNGRQAYYMHAQTLGSSREYRLLVLDGLKVYKFVMVQPFGNIKISEVSAMAALKKIAEKAQF